jgi:hypothetical protein
MKQRVLRLISSENDRREYAIRRDTKEEGRISWTQEGKRVCVDLLVDQRLNGKEKLHFLQFAGEHLTRRFHLEKIILRSHANMDWKLLNSCGYDRKGTQWEKKTDPLRLKESDRIFDREGYIIDQGRMQDIPFGWFNTMEKGCGWIAAWNLLRLNGKEVPMQEVIRDLEKHAVLGEAAGVNLITLMAYLQKQGLKVSLSFPSDRLAVKAVRNSSSGILIYNHKQGAHYTAFCTLQGETVHFYNAVYGQCFHEEPVSAFLKRNDFLPISMVITVEKGA